MNFRSAFYLGGTLLLITGIGCKNPAIVQLSPDTYMLSKEDHAGIFGSMAKLKADVINQANAFAAAQGKIAIPLASKESPVGVLGHWASFEYQFRVVDKNDPEARRTSLLPRPDIVADETNKTSVDVHIEDKSKNKKDVYAELIKLDDLRKRGIITDAEFEAQKKKLLDEN